MRYTLFTVILIGFQLSSAQPLDTNWRALFNGTDLNNWYAYVVPPTGPARKHDIPTADPDSTYRVVNGLIVHRIKVGVAQTSGLLVTDSIYSRYIFRVDYKFGPNCSQGVTYCKNSGLLYDMLQDGVWGVGIESNMYWSWPTAFAPLGGVTATSSRPNFGNFQAGADSMSQWSSDTGWNTMEVRVWADSLVQQYVNGHLGGWGMGIKQPGGARLLSGRIALQAEGNDVSFRNPQIRGFAPAIVKVSDDGPGINFFSLMNGRLTIRGEGNYSVEVVNLEGRKVFSGMAAKSTAHDFRKLLPRGLYVLKLRSGVVGSEKILARKIILD